MTVFTAPAHHLFSGLQMPHRDLGLTGGVDGTAARPTESREKSAGESYKSERTTNQAQPRPSVATESLDDKNKTNSISHRRADAEKDLSKRFLGLAACYRKPFSELEAALRRTYSQVKSGLDQKLESLVDPSRTPDGRVKLMTLERPLSDLEIIRRTFPVLTIGWIKLLCLETVLLTRLQTLPQLFPPDKKGAESGSRLPAKSRIPALQELKDQLEESDLSLFYRIGPVQNRDDTMRIDFYAEVRSRS